MAQEAEAGAALIIKPLEWLSWPAALATPLFDLVLSLTLELYIKRVHKGWSGTVSLLPCLRGTH